MALATAFVEQHALRELPSSGLQELEPAFTDKREVSVPATPASELPTPVFATARSRSTLRQEWLSRQMFACYASMLVAGMSDASAGPLLPAIEAYYGLSYSTVSLIWISQAIGFLVASFSMIQVTAWLGEGKTYATVASLHLCAYVAIVPAPPFVVVCLAYGLIGLCQGFMLARVNTYQADLPKAHQKLSATQGLYGIGAVLTPITSTALLDNNVRWSYAYLVPLSLAVVNICCVVNGFRLKRDPPPVASADSEVAESPTANLKRALKSKTALLYCLFTCLYVGTEVSAGGWLTSYLQEKRGAGKEAGFISSAFWGGVTLGRLILPDLGVRIGEWRFILGITIIAAVLQVLVWTIPVFAADSAFYALSGLCLSVHYPLAASMLTKILPRSLHVGCLGLQAAIGQTGAALFPFAFGLIATRTGVGALEPYLLGMLVAMGSVWLVCPRPKRSSE